MLRFLSVPLCALLLSGSTVEEGQAWLKKAEEQLYRWPQPPALVRFEIHTDVLAPMIAAMKHDLEQKPDAEGSRFVEALEKLEARGTIDTATGKLETEIKLECPDADPRSKKAMDAIRQRVQVTLKGCFASLPLADPILLRKGAPVSSAEELKDERVITSSTGQHGGTTVLHFARDTGLPTRIDLPQLTIGVAYVEATPGRYVPAHLDMQSKVGPSSRADFSWQHQGDVWFPEHVKLSSKGGDAKLDFDHIVIEPRKP